MIKFDLNDRVAIVTGGAQGFGLAITKRFIESGANVIIWDIDENEMKKAIDNVNSKKLSYQIVDVSNNDLINDKLTQVENSHGKIDIFINNAGITGMNTTVVDYPVDEWNKVINLNLTSSFLLSKYSIKKMMKNKNGKIINITSVVGHTGNIGQANYAASKAGLIGMSKSLALEYGKKNIKINCISPGFIKSEMTEKISDSFKEILQEKISLNRFGVPEDVANAVVFLSSDLANYITGETIHVNGGMYFS